VRTGSIYLLRMTIQSLFQSTPDLLCQAKIRRQMEVGRLIPALKDGGGEKITALSHRCLIQ